jgi:transcriptional regulatory protein LevR
VEVCRQIVTSDKSIDEIADLILGAYKLEITSAIDDARMPEAFSSDIVLDYEKCIIITYCITGTGSARLIRERLMENATIAKTAEVIPMGINDDISATAKRYGNRLKLIIGLLNPRIAGVPYIGVDVFLEPDGPLRVNYILNGLNILGYKDLVHVENLDPKERIDFINRNIHSFAPSLPAEKVIEQAAYITERIAALYHVSLPAEMYLRIYIHSVSMLERLISPDGVSAPSDMTKIIHDNYAFFQNLKNIFREFEGFCGINVSEKEVFYYLLALPNPESFENDDEIKTEGN